MKTYLKRLLAIVMIATLLIPMGMTVTGSAAAEEEPMLVSSVSDVLDEKSEELAKNLAEKGIKKAIGSIPVIGKVAESIAGPYIKKLLGIKEGESTGAKLDRIESKLETLVATINSNTQTEMRKIYEAKFDSFNEQLSYIKDKTDGYITQISKYEKKDTSDEEKTLLIAGLTDKNSSDFIKYLDAITMVSRCVNGDLLSFYEQGDIFSRAYFVYCYDLWDEEGCALGGEAAMMNAEYVNAISEIVDAAQTTAAIMIAARCSVGDSIEGETGYAKLQADGKITSDVPLTNFNQTDADIYKTMYETLKKLHYDIFGVSEEEAKEEEANENTVKVSAGAVGRYNQMIADHWFDYIDKVTFDGPVPEVSYTEMDGEIGVASLADYGFEESRAQSLYEDAAVSYLKGISGKALADKHAALTDEQFNKLLKHIETSKNFKYEKEFEGADEKKISLRDALIKYGFSFEGSDIYNDSIYSCPGFFVTNAKCEEDYVNSLSSSEHDGYIDGYVYGINADTATADINSKSAITACQYFKGHFSNYSADKKDTNFPQFAMLYFKNTIELNSTTEFKDFIKSIANGNTYAGKSISLNCDVNLSQTDYLNCWSNANHGKEFKGTFNGNRHTIKSFHLSTDDHRIGLFRTTGDGAVIKNLIFDDVQLQCTGKMNGCAALVGYANGSLLVENVTVDSGSISGYKYVGGLIGETKSGKYTAMTLRRCDNFVAITSEDTEAAGLIGNCAAVFISDCINGGTITAKKGAAGGLVGYVGNKDTDPDVSVEYCYNHGKIIGYDCAGGIIGHIYSDNGNAIVTQNTNTGDVTVTGKRSAGGIVGRTCTGGTFSDNRNSGNIVNLATTDDAEAGGILGENEDDAITVSGNENSGNVTANKRAGGIAGTLGDRDHDKTCTVSNNTNSGRILSNAKDAGGIVGAVATDNTSHVIENNVNTGVVEGYSETGGIVGWMAGGGTFDSNTNSSSITSVSLNAGGLVGRIQDDKCEFRKSVLGNAYAGVGELSAGVLAGCDYAINAKSTSQHAGIICGWDGKRGKSINNDTLLASILGEGRIVMIAVLVGILIAAAVVFAVVYKKKKKPAGSAEASDAPEIADTAENDEIAENANE